MQYAVLCFDCLRTRYIELRTENEKLRGNLDIAEGVVMRQEKSLLVMEKQLAAQEKVIEEICGILGNPRWLSIGAIHNYAECRISRKTYEDLLATLTKE